MIHKQVTPPDVNWLEILDSVLFAIRVSRHCSTKSSPFRILYGHEPKLPSEMDYEIKKRQSSSSISSSNGRAMGGKIM